MMDIKEKILAALADREYTPCKKEEFYKKYVADGGTPEYSAFEDAFLSLKEEYEVALSKKGKVIRPEDAGYVKGRFSQAKNGYGFVCPENGEDVFIPERFVGGTMNGDTVVALLEFGKDGRSYGKILTICQRAYARVIGTLVIRGNGSRHPSAYVIPDDTKLNFIVLVSPKDVGEAKNGQKVEVQILRYPEDRDDHPRGKVTAVFGDTFSREANYESILRANAVPTEFSDAVLAAAEKVSRQPVDPAGRTDLRDRIVFTIDGADAKDLDDAISCERTENGYCLGVHIADVSHYVRYGDPVDEEAFSRGTSLYFVDQVVPMLPRSLSNGACSLNGGEDRYALSALMTLDAQGNLLSTDIRKTVIRSRVRGVYTEVNDLFEQGESSAFREKYGEVLGTLTVMRELYRVLRNRFVARGAIEIDSEEAKILLDESGFPVRMEKRIRGEAECLIEQFMLCANEAVAAYLNAMSAPCVYRVHEEPSADKIQEFAVFAHNLGVNTASLRSKKRTPSQLAVVLDDAREKGVSAVVSDVLLRSLMKARYSDTAGIHFGLATELYCHFTSPIRRYPDLSVHRILTAILEGKDYGALEKFAHRSAVVSSENELRALSAEREIEALYKTMYMSRRIGMAFDVTVTSVMSFGVFVRTDELCEGMIPLSDFGGNASYDERGKFLTAAERTYRPGDRLRVRVMEADIVSRKVTFSLLSESAGT